MSGNARVHLLPNLFEPGDLRGGTAVVIDVLRASTTILHALAAGASCVIPCAEIEEARHTAARFPADQILLGGERGGRPIDGFDLGNSPLDYAPDRVRGRTVVFTTTNGTRALKRCDEADRVLIAAFNNLRAVVREVVETNRPVHLVCAGTDGAITAEDVLCAGALAAELQDRLGVEEWSDDPARIAVDFSEAHAENQTGLRQALQASRGGRNLRSLGDEADIDRAAQRDRFDFVPVYDPATGRIVIRSGAKRSARPRKKPTAENAEITEREELNKITDRIIGAAIRVHQALGPGLLESAYEACLEFELQRAGLKVERQKPIPIHYGGVYVDCGYRVDLLVEDSVIVELKSVSEVVPIHHAQLLSHLRLAGCKLGLLINFNVRRLKDGIKRIVNDF